MSGYYNMYFSAQTFRILIVGEEKSGKTVNLKKFKKQKSNYIRNIISLFTQ